MSIRRLIFFLLVAVAFLLATGTQTTSLNSNGNSDNTAGLVAGRNVNMVSGTTFPDGDPYLQRQNEPSIAVSTRNPLHLLAGANDYRSIDIAMEDKLPGPEGTNLSPAPDAWLGVFKSIDGGSTWTSTLLPGFSYKDTTPTDAPPSPLYGFSAAADPVVRAGPNGLFFYAGIVFDREDRGDSAVFVSRFIDNNNKENVDTTAYIDTQIQARGSAGQFIDKPWLAVDVPYQEYPSITIDLPDPDIDRQYVTRCNVYLAYSVFLGNPDLNIRTKVYFARSTDSGMTWENPTKLTETQHISQGATIAVDPSGNGHVWVAWRRFAHINNKGQVIQPDAIVVVKSEDGGATFTKPFVVAELAPWFPPSDNGVFDQPTTHHSFRTNDYPTMAVDHNGTPYIAWTQRGLGPSTDPGVGEARIVMTALMSDGVSWSPPTQVISGSEPVDPNPPGHQLMPQLTYAAGKLTLLWYDQRWDVIRLFLPFIEDVYLNVRHTIDVRVAQAEILSYPVFSPSIQVSKYPFLLFHDEIADVFMAYQLFYNKPNLPLFSLGTRPFMGDYIGIAPSPMFLSPEDPNNPTDYWIYNKDSSVPTIYHAVWTDNRDVVHPDEIPLLPGDTPDLGEWDQYNAPGEGCVNGNWTGIRNQNIYTSRISEGILAGSPGNTKPLNILRSFAVFVQNMTGVERTFDLEIIKPSGLEAYFWQEGGGPIYILEDVFVPPYSYVSKTILVEAYSSEYTSIIINIYDAESGKLVDYVTLNPDSTNPIIDEPEDMAAGNPHPRNEGETHTPHPRNYTIIDWNTEQYDPYINTIIPQYDEVVANNDGITPYPVEGDVDNPHGRNPHGRNPHPRNPHGRNFLLNPHPRNEHISDIEDGSQMTDVVWTIENSGNTTTSYSIDTFETPKDLPEGVLAQLIVFKTYTTPAVDIWDDADGCQLIEQEHQEMVVNLTTPHPRNPTTPHPRNLGELGDISVNVPPNGVFHVLYRYYNPYDSPEQIEFHDQGKYEEAVPDIVSDTPDTDHDIILDPPKPLVIPPQELPNGATGVPYPDTTLLAVGGTGAHQSWLATGDWPDGLALDPGTGIISGTPTTAGIYNFAVTVQDSATPPQTSFPKNLSITINPTISGSVGIAGATITFSEDEGPTIAITSDSYGGYSQDVSYGWSGTVTPTLINHRFEPVSQSYSNVTSKLENQDFIAIRLYLLTIIIQGNGSGTVTSDPGGINCEGDCTEIYDMGTPVTLTATPAGDSDFAGWSGHHTGMYNPDTITMNSDKTITATFNLKQYTLDVNLIGNGTGIVNNTPPNIDCLVGTCSETYNHGTTVTLTATPYAGSTFAGWSGYLSSIVTPVSIFMDGYKNIDASFYPLPITDGSLVSWWPGDDNAYDIVGGNHGSLENGTIFGTGLSGKAFDFDGIDDWVLAPGTNIDNLQSLTIEAWVKLDSLIAGKINRFVTLMGEKAVLRHDGATQQGQLHFYMNFGSPLNHALYHIRVNDVLRTDCYHHIVGTYNISKDLMLLYLDGIEVGSLDVSGTVAPGGGVELSSDWEQLDGRLDDVRIYNRALTVEEIEGLYNAGSSGKCSPSTKVFVNGVMSPGEWDTDPCQFDFLADLPVPPAGAGETTPGTLFIQNDEENIYFAVRYVSTPDYRGSTVGFRFDNDNDGIMENGDDVILTNPYRSFIDDFRSNILPCTPGSGQGSCGPRDIDHGGTNDGKGVYRHYGTYIVFEMSHPLNTTDDLHDISLLPGNKVGIHMFLQLTIQLPTPPGGSSEIARTEVPPGWGNYHEITITGVNPRTPTTTSLVSSTQLVEYGTSVTLTATVVPAPTVGDVPEVEFFDGTTSLGTAQANANGIATLNPTIQSFGVHSFIAKFVGTSNHSESTSNSVTAHMIRRFDDLASFTTALGGASTSIQNFNSYTPGAPISTIFSEILDVQSSFDYLEARYRAAGDNILFGYDTEGSTREDEEGEYEFDFVSSPNTHNAFALDIMDQHPQSSPAQVEVNTDVGTLTFPVLNQDTQETTPKFFGVIVTGPIQSIFVHEGIENGENGGNEEIGLDNIIIAVVNVVNVY